MIILRDTPAASRFLDLLWAEAQRQQNEKRDESPSRQAQHAT